MKKLVTTVLALATVTALAANAFAANLMMEGFNYADGSLTPSGGWSTHSGTDNAPDNVQVVSGRAVGIGGSLPDHSRVFGAQSATASTYACFEVSIAPPVTGTPQSSYFFHFRNAGTGFPGRVYVVPSGASNFTFAVSANSTSATTPISPVIWGSVLNYNTTYYLVVKYNAQSGTATLWVNPLTEASTSISHTNANAVGLLVEAACLRQGTTTSTTYVAGFPNGNTVWNFSLDNLGVGTSFGEACNQVTPATQSTWGRVKTMYR